jgi:hypothetical protein
MHNSKATRQSSTPAGALGMCVAVTFGVIAYLMPAAVGTSEVPCKIVAPGIRGSTSWSSGSVRGSPDPRGRALHDERLSGGAGVVTLCAEIAWRRGCDEYSDLCPGECAGSTGTSNATDAKTSKIPTTQTVATAASPTTPTASESNDE